jgi:transposase
LILLAFQPIFLAFSFFFQRGNSYFEEVKKEELLAENKALKAENAILRFELENLKRAVFGRSSERFVGEHPPAEQLNMFAEENGGKEDAQEPIREVITYERKKPKAKPHPGRTPIPEHFPEEVEVIEPEEDTEGLIKIGEERSEWVEYTPASLVKKVVIRPKYVRPESDERTSVLIGKLPDRPIPKSIAGASLLAYLIVSKFVDHLPFYRQIKRFEREFQWSLHKSTLNSWFVAVCTLLKPLYEELHKKALQVDYLQADESKIKVLTNLPRDKEGNPKVPEQPKGSKQMLGWMWVVHNPLDGYVVFNYEDNRSAKGARATLKDFRQGYLQTDGYQSYNGIAARPEVHRLGCLAHVRRKFFEAQKNDPVRANHALSVFQQIYAHEQKAKSLSAEDRKAYRKEHVLPIYKGFKYWLDEQMPKVTPKSVIGSVMDHTQRQWPNLMTLFQDGRLLIDNNRIENKIRPLALGRKNYLFAGSHEAAQRIAMIYSFFATCQMHNLNPMTWLTDTLSRLPNTKMSDLHKCLPNSQWSPRKPKKKS